MAIKSGMFNSVGGDRRYKAEDFAAYFATFIGNGVFPNPSTGFQVLANGNMTVTLKLGKGWINGYYITNDDNFTLTIDPSDSALNRIDRVVLQLNYLNRAISPVIKKGTPATAPVAPTPKRDADAYELVLADIAINKGALVLSQSNITDQRLNTALCGIVHGVVDQVDTTTIFNQYQAWYQTYTATKSTEFNAWEQSEKQDFTSWKNTQKQDYASWSAEQQSIFLTWFESIKGLLDGDVATNLAARIQTLQDDFNVHKNEKASLTVYGHTQLSSATNSDSETLAATPKAVKVAMDRADAAFTSASNGKSVLAPAITGKGVPTNASDSFQQMATNINNIHVGDYSVGEYIKDINLNVDSTKGSGNEIWSKTDVNVGSDIAVDELGNVYCTYLNSTKTVRKLDFSGNEIWSKSLGYTGGIAVDKSGNVYIVHPVSSGITVRKLDSNGEEIWSKSDSPRGYAVALDNNGNVYIGYDVSSGKWLQKLDSSGNEIWSKTTDGSRCNGVAVDKDGNVYCALGSTAGVSEFIIKYNSAGTKVWVKSDIKGTRGITVDKDGNVYCAHYDAGVIRKLDSGGNVIWSVSNPLSVSVAVDSAGNIYCTSASGSPVKTVRKLDKNGNEVWGKDDVSSAQGIAVDSKGLVYVAYQGSVGTKSVRKLDGATYYKITN